MRKTIRKYLQTIFLIILSFILGSMFTISITPIEKTCRLQDSDREYNIMKNSKFRNPELIILILSAPRNLDKRSAIRETWMKLAPKPDYSSDRNEKVKHYFVVGSLGQSRVQIEHLNEEQLQYKDILMLPMYDSYKNLTKKVKESFKWLDEQYDYGLGFKYVLKCDDDSFVNLKVLVSELTDIEKKLTNINKATSLREMDEEKLFYSINIQTNDNEGKSNLSLYWGYFSGNARIKTKGKWKENDWIASDRYIPYALGGGYLLSKDLISYIAKNADNLRSFNAEDVSVGLWLAPLNNLIRIHDVRFDTEWTSRGCKNSHLITHNISPTVMKNLYNNIMKNEVMCIKETTKRKYYLYDWKVPPSQCCQAVEKIIRLTGQ